MTFQHCIFSVLVPVLGAFYGDKPMSLKRFRLHLKSSELNGISVTFSFKSNNSILPL